MKIFRTYRQTDEIISQLVAFAVTAASFFLTRIHTANYLKDHLLRGDANSYFYLYAKGLSTLQSDGPIEAWRLWVADNDRMPLQFALMFIWKLAGFSNQLSVELINVFAWVFFTFIFCKSLRTVATSWGVIVGLLVSLVLSRFNFEPSLGAMSFFPEGSSIFFFGSALISLVFSNLGQSREQMTYFGVAASLCVLSRYVAVAYLLFAAGPILLFYIFLAIKERRFRSTLWDPLARAGAIIAVLALPFLLIHLQQVVEFYRVFGYGLGSHTVWESLSYVSDFLIGHYRIEFLLVIYLGVISWLTVSSDEEILRHSLASWVAFAHVFMMVLVLKNYDDVQTSMFLVIGLYLGFCIFIVSLVKSDKGALAKVVMVIVSLNVAYLPEALRIEVESNSEAKSIDFYRAVSSAVADAVPDADTIYWAAGWAEDFVKPAYLGWKERSKLLLSSQTYMTNHISHWTGFYPLATKSGQKERISNRVFSEIKYDSRVAVVRKDPLNTMFTFRNELSEFVAQDLSRSFKSEPGWELFREISDGPFGAMEVYRKKVE